MTKHKNWIVILIGCIFISCSIFWNNPPKVIANVVKTPIEKTIVTIKPKETIPKDPDPNQTKLHKIKLEKTINEDFYTTTAVNLRKQPNTKSKILNTLYSRQKIHVISQTNDWSKIKTNHTIGYVKSEYLTPVSETNTTTITVPISDTKFKSWMPYTAITSKSSKQYKLQATQAVTGIYGIRQINGRFCVAMGTYFGLTIGTEFDLILANNTVIPCIAADEKADIHTDNNNLQTIHDNSIVEFIVDSNALNKNAKLSGNISSCNPNWDSNITKIIKYK